MVDGYMKKMPMLKHLLLIVVIVLAGCAQPPVANLEDVRSVVAHAYASGAARYAPGEYQLASSALIAAEQQVKNGDTRKALNTLELARRYSSEALNITLEHKKQLALEQQRLAEEKRLDEERKELLRERELELQRQVLLKKQQELKDAAAKERKKIKVETKVVKKVVVPKVSKPLSVGRIEVMPGEDLAAIAARPEVYKDALLWPLIYRANRDQIKDPKEIFAGQIFVIPRDKNRDDEDAARHEAKTLNLF
jgi:nucleoid-associated protein YgaU